MRARLMALWRKSHRPPLRRNATFARKPSCSFRQLSSGGRALANSCGSSRWRGPCRALSCASSRNGVPCTLHFRDSRFTILNFAFDTVASDPLDFSVSSVAFVVNDVDPSARFRLRGYSASSFVTRQTLVCCGLPLASGEGRYTVSVLMQPPKSTSRSLTRRASYQAPCEIATVPSTISLVSFAGRHSSPW